MLEQELKDAQRWLSDPAARVYFWNVLRMGLRVRGVKPEYLLLERLRALAMPVLVAWGGKDQILHVSNVEKIRKVLPNARYEIFPEAGHMITYEEPARFNRTLIDFLRQG